MISYEPPAGLYKKDFPEGGFWYWYKGAPIRSVSKILNRIWPVPPDLPAFYLERGRLVHAATVMIDNGTLDWATVDPRILPFCEAHRDFLTMARPVTEACELTVVHPSYTFGARLDRVYRLPGQSRLVVTDIKCGMGKDDRYWCQCAACAIALDETHVADYDLALLNLDDKGRPHFSVAEDPGSWVDRFRSILAEDKAA